MSPASCYTAREIQQRLKMSRATFTNLKRAGKLPFLEEIKPRLGAVIRYRADLVDTYLRGEWQRPRFGGLRRIR
jgi:helix-turn-helix protein